MTPLNIPVPPMLEQAVGLPDTPARYFSLYWEPCGDEVTFDDGRSSGTGCWTGYLAWTRHPAVALALAGYNLGSSDHEATHRLLIDRRERKAFVGTWRDVARKVREQWPAQEPVTLSKEEWAALIDRLNAELRSRPMPTMDEITTRMEEQRRLEDQMARWLDSTPQAAAGREAIRRMVEGGNAGEGGR